MAVEVRENGAIVVIETPPNKKVEVERSLSATIEVETGIIGVIPNNYGLITYDGSVLTVS